MVIDSNSELLATAGRIAGRSRRGADVREWLDSVGYRLSGTPLRREALLKWLKIAGPIAAVLLLVGGYFLFRPVPKPNYQRDSLKKVFNYTLLTDEFNRLSIEERLKLIGQLVQRMKSMSAGDSVLMAAFAAGIAGKAREQIEANASRLAIDLWDKYASDYSTRSAGLSQADRGALLDATFLDFVKNMEAVTGETSDKSDTDRLSEVRQQAKRDQEAMKDGKFAPPAQALGRMFDFMRNNVGDHASPAQRSRGQLLMRDMVRHFRGQDGGGGG
jgi:hypothetical protein